MGKNVTVKMSQSGARELLKSLGVQADLKARADRIASSACAMTSSDDLATDPFIAKSNTTKVSARAVVISATPHGDAASNRNGVLLKSLGAGK